jgi:hypothetical protein
MKPFDLEAAKRGEPIVTRDGRPAKFIAHVPEANACYQVVALFSGLISTHAVSGRVYPEKHPNDADLFMAPRKRTVWVNVYPPEARKFGGPTKLRQLRITMQAMSASATAHGRWK